MFFLVCGESLVVCDDWNGVEGLLSKKADDVVQQFPVLVSQKVARLRNH